MLLGPSALVLWTTRYEAALAFYRALGLPLANEQHDDGPTHAACELGGVHVALYPATQPGPPDAPSHRRPGATLIGFDVDDLESVYEALQSCGATVDRAPEDVPWGRRAVVRDPDGRPIELNQPGVRHPAEP